MVMTTRRGADKFSLWAATPLLIIPVLIYNFIAFFGISFARDDALLDAAREEAVRERVVESSLGAVAGRLGDETEPADEAVSKALRTQANINGVLVKFPMPAAGVSWSITTADVILIIALICLFVELIRSTSSRKTSIINHGLSMVLFVFCLIEFLLFGAFATSVFFLLTLMVLLDVLAGFIVTTVTARRDFSVGGEVG